MKQILIVGSQHGNELLGELLYEHLQKQAPQSGCYAVEYYLANPRAREANVRYIESDMNRSYGQGTETYEQQRAAELANYIRGHLFDLVVDAHTTTVNQPPCIIVPDITPENAAFLRACHISNIVVMKHQFVQQALIGTVPRTVSIEISNSQLTTELFDRLQADFAAYALDERTHAHKDIYVVEELLKKTEVSDPKEILHNFERCTAGFYPILVGENSYKKQTDYLGFKARTKQSRTI